MNARELSNLLEKYNVGYIVLEKTYPEDNEIYAYVINPNGKYSDKIIINDSTSGFETESEICEEDYEDFEICDLQFYHTAWAYPYAGIDEPGGGIEVAEKNCGIRLVNDPILGNQIDLYVEQAIKMFIDPLKYQNWLLEAFLQEQTLLIDKHYSMLKELGYWQEYSDLYKRGLSSTYESEPYIVFTTITGVSNLIIHQNLFTGKFVFLEELKEIVINELSTEELKNILLKRFEENDEMYWRNERNK